MAITEADIKLLASERMTDNADGGGFMTGSVVPDNVENNAFPDVSDADRTFGRVQLRKVYCAVTSEDQDAFLGAHAIIDETPEDPAVSCLMVTKAGYDQARADIVDALDSSSYKVVIGSQKHILSGAVLTAEVSDELFAQFAPPTTRRSWNGTAWVDVQVPGGVVAGDILGLFTVQAADPIPSVDTMEVVYVAAVPGGVMGFGGSFPLTALELSQPVQRSYNNNVDVTYNSNAGGGYTSAPGLGDWAVKLQQDIAEGALKFYGQTVTTGVLEPGDTTLPVASTLAQYIPVGDGGVYPTVAPAVLGVDPDPYSGTFGRVQIFRADEALVIHHTATAAPGAVTNGQDVNLGRDRLAKVQVFGNDGNEITAGFTVNLVTGHVVFTNVAGYSQPVTIRHRVEDMLLIASANEGTIEVARGVTHDFPAGSKVSSVLMFGDLQAAVHDGWAQATWTGVWSDDLIGSAPTADFFEALNPIVVTNAGAITERWAVIFTSATAFRVVGEQVGQVVTTGSTGVDTAPVNPATGAPYFTLPSAGWGAGWAAGNVFRFNTDGANAPVWLIRSIAPSDPYSGQDKFTVALRGNVNA